MTRRDWWLGVFVLAGCLLLHALVPRYEFHAEPFPVVVDRWTGAVHRAILTP